jgi:SAM-dependent methyltransferase
MSCPYVCRHCASLLQQTVIDLGHQPPSNAYLTAQQLLAPEIFYPLRVYVCTSCWLVQLPEHAAAKELFTPNYPYFSSTSSSWCTHAELFVAQAVIKLQLNSNSKVVEIASNDGYLLQYVKQRNIPCLGIEPTTATASAARAKGLETVEKFFGVKLADELVSKNGMVEGGADLVVANNVLAHVPDINDFLSGICRLLKPHGRASIEFPHLLEMLTGNQFDTIYHEHFSYLSLRVLQRIARTVGLVVESVEQLSTHGGSLRVWLARDGFAFPSTSVNLLLDKEKVAGLETLEAYEKFQRHAEASKHGLIQFLLDAKCNDQLTVAYGAAAKGNTLLNYAGIKGDLLPAVADRATSKQGLFLPGSHIPVITPDELTSYPFEFLLVLPWNLITEIRELFPSNNLVTAIPRIHHLPALVERPKGY